MVCLGRLAVWGQSHVSFYDEEDGLPHGHVTQLLQDQQGFMWFATWNGLCRYDGYEFHTFKPAVGDGCQMLTDRFRDIALRPDGHIICRVDDDYFLFDTHTYQFCNLTAEQQQQAAKDIARYRKSKSLKSEGTLTFFSYTDLQGNLWKAVANGVSKETPVIPSTERLDIQPEAEVKCLFADSKQRYWVTTKNDASVRVYAASDDRLLGYLGTDGQLHQGYTRFEAPVYCMHESADGTLWMGSKPSGLFRLHEMEAGKFKIDHFADIPNSNVYHIAEDRWGRLWLATLGGGICYTIDPRGEHPRFLVPKCYPTDAAQRVRYLFLTQDSDILLAAATDGLVVAQLEANAQNIRFHRHSRESNRAESLSSGATMDVMQDASGRIFVSTESGGINRVKGANLLTEPLSFEHYTADGHQLPSDVVLSLTPMERGGMMVVSNHLVVLIDSMGHYRQLDARYFNADYRFSDAHPLPLSGGRWLFGLKDGAFITSIKQMYRKTYQPKLVLTGVSIQGGADNWAVTNADTLVLKPSERSVTIRFAALDYSAPERILYAFRLLPNEKWNYIGHDHSATLLDLVPGTYQMEICSTNADGEWLQNHRTLTLIVQPTFWESVWGRLLIALLIAGTLAIIAYTLLYIKRIKRKQRETLEKYLALIEVSGEYLKVRSEGPEEREGKEVDPMLQRVMQFVEENLSNSDASVGDMAAVAATSRSGLQRKLKQAMGITPQDLLREARIKKARQLLRQSDKTVAEVAYACGFTDPKYFSRCFKQSVGQSPTDYKNAS